MRWQIRVLRQVLEGKSVSYRVCLFILRVAISKLTMTFRVRWILWLTNLMKAKVYEPLRVANGPLGGLQATRANILFTLCSYKVPSGS